jgi:epoxyqueuosine reductase
MGFHADMRYMERNFKKRVNPSEHLPDARSVIIFGTNYYNTGNDSNIIKGISVYARGTDYHLVLKKRIKGLMDEIKRATGAYFNMKIFVDSSPILERAIARRAGIGWIGKNSCLINPKLGSYLFISGVVLDMEIEPDEPTNNSYCGKCRKCIDACPTGAIVSPYVVDSRLCISYHTIENRGNIPEIIQKKMSGWVFGCDICQMVCPWNKKTPQTRVDEFFPQPQLKNLKYEDLLNMTEEDFNKLFYFSPIRRAGYKSFLRNIYISHPAG